MHKTCKICKKNNVVKGTICFDCKYTIQEKESSYYMSEDQMDKVIAAADQKDESLLAKLFASFYHFDFHECMSFSSIPADRQTDTYALAALKEFFIYIPTCDMSILWSGLKKEFNDFYNTIKHLENAKTKKSDSEKIY